jgi:hypothetical protein
MCPLTIYLGRLFGLLFLVLALAMVLHRQSFAEIAPLMIQDRPAFFLLGLITLTAGLAVVLAHNIWTGGLLPVIITLFGWITLIRGLIILLAPPEALASFLEKTNLASTINVGIAVSFVLGAYLIYAGFTRRL